MIYTKSAQLPWLLQITNRFSNVKKFNQNIFKQGNQKWVYHLGYLFSMTDYISTGNIFNPGMDIQCMEEKMGNQRNTF